MLKTKIKSAPQWVASLALIGSCLVGVSSPVWAAQKSTHSAFDYITVSELMEIDNRIALEQEMANAESLGIEGYKSKRTRSKELEILLEKEQVEVELAAASKKEQEQDEMEAPSISVVGIYGIGNQLSALVQYQGETYQFQSGQKASAKQTQKDALRLVGIKGNCVTVARVEDQRTIKQCL